jgi:multidrug efflux pump
MLFATFLGVLLIPVFYVVVRRLLGDKLDGDTPRPGLNAPHTFDSDPQRGH